MSLPLVKYVLIAAFRDRLFISTLIFAAVIISLSIFLGSSAVTEQNTFVLVFGSGGLRIAGVVALILFICSYVRRAFDAREIDYLLSRPLSKPVFLFSHIAAFIFIAILIGIMVAGCVFALAGGNVHEGFWLWSAGLLMEFTIMACIALFFSLFLGSLTTSALMCGAFYILARLIGQIIGIIEAPLTTGKFGFILEPIMMLISIVIPRFDLIGQTSWLVYGPDDTVGFGFIILQGVLFSVLVISASLLDLLRKQF